MPRRLITIATLTSAFLVAACSGSVGSATTASTNAAAPHATTPLRVLVTNDDGVKADGINVLVQALRKVPNTTVVVVAPLKNQSGSGSKTTKGPLKVTTTTTKGGYAAKAVAGYPADTIVWAIDKHGVAKAPDVVLSGVNFGQNMGSLIDVSGTIGAARAAALRGIPALAVSADIRNPDYARATKAALAWLAKHRAALPTAKPTVTNLNVPTCPSGSPRKLVIVPVAPKGQNPLGTVDCVSPFPTPTNDVNGFVHGYTVQTDKLPLKPKA